MPSTSLVRNGCSAWNLPRAVWPVSGRAGGTRWANCSPPASLRAPSPASPSPRALCSQARTICPAPQGSSSRLPALIHLPSAPRPQPQMCPPPPHLGLRAGLATFLTSDSGPCFYCCPPRPSHQCPPMGRSWPPPVLPPPDHGLTLASQWVQAGAVLLRANIQRGPSLPGPVLGEGSGVSSQQSVGSQCRPGWGPPGGYCVCLGPQHPLQHRVGSFCHAHLSCIAPRLTDGHCTDRGKG